MPHVKIFSKYLRAAARCCIMLSEQNLEKKLFPYWKEAIHEIVEAMGGCSCSSDVVGSCVLDMNDDEVRNIVNNGDLCFESFLKIFSESQDLIFADPRKKSDVN